MKRTIIYIIMSCTLILSSCKDYLERTPDAALDVSDVFKDFEHAQGFTEVLYRYVINHACVGRQNDATNFLLGDETVSMNGGMCCYHWEIGNLVMYKNGYFSRMPGDPAGYGIIDGKYLMFRFGIWQGWQAIRICNIILENVDKMTGATQTEKDLLKGQALFFRAFFHNEIMMYWGRIPYVDKVLAGDEDVQIPRPASYKECAMKADADYAAAAELLPNNWDDLINDPTKTFLTFKKQTLGSNLMRINKVIVYSFKGKNLLLAASPLMKGSRDTYDYDQELCKQAAEAFAHVIKMDRDNVNDLGLTSRANYNGIFYTTVANSTNWPGTAKNTAPGEAEYIFSSVANPLNANQSTPTSFMPYTSAANFVTPNHKYIHRTFGTANGLPCDEDPTFDPQKEFDNRDPRFYQNVMIDGDEIIKDPSAPTIAKYAQLYTTGAIRNIPMIYHTGYFIKKWCDVSFNKTASIQSILPGSVIAVGDNKTGINVVWLNMRLTDVYLMYAEALAATSDYGVDVAPTYSFLEDAPSSLSVINMIRDRFSVPHVETAYQTIGINIKADRNKYMDVVRTERATELCFEGDRWTDLRRWQLADKLEYRTKTALDFERDVYPTPANTPTANLQRGQFRDINFKERVILTRVCEYPKHFWLPFPTSQTQMYPGFEQNPGW